MRENATLGIIFSNVHDEQLGVLTEKRTTGSVPFGGRYRLIDFTLSNMVNSGVEDVGIIAKSNYQSLMDHVGNGKDWDLARKRGGLRILPPFGHANSGIYRGRLEALFGAMSFIRHSLSEYVIIADGSLIANMDYEKILAYHEETGADITVVYQKETLNGEIVPDTALLDLDESGRVTGVRLGNQFHGEQNSYLDVCVMKKNLLERLVSDLSSRNLYSFSRDLLQGSVGTLHIQGYEFTGFARKVCSLKSFYASNMELLSQDVRKALFLKERPIYTKVRDEPPARYGLSASASNSFVADGAVIEGRVENSIIFRGAKIGKDAVVKNSIIMQGSTIGEGANLDYVITDKNVLIKDSRILMGFATYPVFIAKGSIV